MALAPLPKINHPTFPILVPSLNKAGRFRPFTVKEEKILLMARESLNPIDHFRAVHQIVNNCTVDLDATQFKSFDVDWLFLKITASSVKETVQQSFNDIEEKNAGLEPLKVYTFDIRLDDVVAPVVPPSELFRVTLEDGSGVDLQYPAAILYTDPAFVDAPAGALLYHSTKSIFDANGTVFDASLYEMKDVVEYYEGWKTEDMKKVDAFIDNVPSMLWTQKYVNVLGNEREIKLSALTDFFTF